MGGSALHDRDGVHHAALTTWVALHCMIATVSTTLHLTNRLLATWVALHCMIATVSTTLHLMTNNRLLARGWRCTA